MPQLCFNQACFAPDTDFGTFVDASLSVGATWVGIWSDRFSGRSPREVARRLRDNGLQISSLNRGGFFASDLSPGLAHSLDQTRRQIDLCAEIGANTLLIVPGGLPEGTKDLAAARARFEEGFAAALPYARQAGITLAIEPFNPALTAIRGVVNRLRDATAICRRAGAGAAVLVDIYHLWWDPQIVEDIRDAADLIAGYHLCDYRAAPRDLVFDRALVGDGVADAVTMTQAVLDAGYRGPFEIEVFSKFDLWPLDPFEAARIYRANFDAHLRELETRA